ncbi:hypothetical protein ACFL17_09760 [Pseudomonadota bacterium]
MKNRIFPQLLLAMVFSVSLFSGETNAQSYLIYDDGQTDMFGVPIILSNGDQEPITNGHGWTQAFVIGTTFTEEPGGDVGNYVEVDSGNNVIRIDFTPSITKLHTAPLTVGNDITFAFDLKIKEMGTLSDSCIAEFINESWTPGPFFSLYARGDNPMFSLDSGGGCGCTDQATDIEWDFNQRSFKLWFNNGELVAYENVGGVDDEIGRCQDTCNRTNAQKISLRNGGYYQNTICEYDNVRVWEGGPDDEPIVVKAAIDIKPTSCPNPINTKSKGKLPVAVLGSFDLDVTDIDPVSIRLEGVSPIRSSIKDVATPHERSSDNANDCTTVGADNHPDLTLKFKTQAIVDALGDVDDGEVRVLSLTGALKDGTEIKGNDVVIIKKKGKKKRN